MAQTPSPQPPHQPVLQPFHFRPLARYRPIPGEHRIDSVLVEPRESGPPRRKLRQLVEQRFGNKGGPATYHGSVQGLRIPDGARVGSVDRFQGQQAPIVIYSLCSSAGEFGSRGLGFILDRNRVNVAISRAQCLAIVVGDPAVAQSPAGSVAEIALLNLYCKIITLAAGSPDKSISSPSAFLATAKPTV